jgi:multiple sugar transport system substrate-binding protein
LVGDERVDRRQFLALAAAGAVCVATAGAGCGSGSKKPAAGGATKAPAPGGGERTLRIAQWSHFVPAYDTWFDNEYIKRWGEEHDVDVAVDHLPINELPFRGDAEIAAGRGHDIFAFSSPRPTLEDAAIDHREIVEQVTARVGPMLPFVERSVRNPRSGRYFGVSDFWAAGVTHYRTSLWDQVERGLRPDSWENVLRAAAPLKAGGHPIGLGYAAEHDSGWTVGTLMQSFGASIQDEAGRVTINSRATVEAVKMGVAIFTAGMTEEVFSWDSASNNRLLTSGRASLITNPISALRAVEQQNAELATDIALAPAPVGPAGDVPRCERFVHCYVVFQLSQHQELAKQFLVDLMVAREPFIRSGFYNTPSCPGAVPDLAELTTRDPDARPPDKYGLLAEAASWMTNVGAPGSLNPAIDETFNRFILPRMFASAARGERTPEEAVADAEAEIRPIFDKWRERGKI